MKRLIVIALLLILMLAGCGMKKELNISKTEWGMLQDGRKVNLYTLENTKGMKVGVCDLGAAVQSIVVPDREGVFSDVTLGYDTFENHLHDQSYQGVTVGRYGNRIAKGQFTIDGQTYQLPVNNGENHLHGGPNGLQKKLWTSHITEVDGLPAVEMEVTSPDGEEGYPGNIIVKAVFFLNNQNEFKITYEATTDRATHLNLTHHIYYNLTGDPDNDILDHELQILAGHVTPVDAGLIPTGELMPVEGTPFDFQKSRRIGSRIEDDDEQLKFGGGYDHNWVFDEIDGTLKNQLRLYEPVSGRIMEMETEEPGIQFYSGNFLDGQSAGKNGKAYRYRHALCLEPQHFPDSPNQPDFPSTLLKPGEVYKTASIMRFSAE